MPPCPACGFHDHQVCLVLGHTYPLHQLLTNRPDTHTLGNMARAKLVSTPPTSGYVPKRRSLTVVARPTHPPIPNFKKPPKSSAASAAAESATAPVKEKKPPVDRNTLPLVSVLGKDDMRRAIEILKEDAELLEQEQLIAEARKDIKDEFVKLCLRNDIPEGLRYGSLSGTYVQMSSTKLDKGKLMLEASVTAKQIENCYVEGKSYYRVDIIDSTRPRKQKPAEDE